MPPILRTLVLTSAAAVLFNIMSPNSGLVESLFKKREDNKPTLSLTSIVQKSEASGEEALIIPPTRLYSWNIQGNIPLGGSRNT